MLVLNRHFVPVHIATVRRAFGLLLKRFAEVVAVEEGAVSTFDLEAWMRFEPGGVGLTEEDEFVATVSRPIRVPRIVRLMGYDRFPRRSVGFSRRNVLARDGYRCQYCGKVPRAADLTLDHVVPRSRGGEHSWTNVVACCRRCNDKKGHRALKETGMRLLKKPARPHVNPVLHRRLSQPKYREWRVFVAV